MSLNTFVYMCRDVKIYRLVSKNSIEEAILHCAEKKLKLEMDVTGSNQKGMILWLDFFSYATQYIYDYGTSSKIVILCAYLTADVILKLKIE